MYKKICNLWNKFWTLKGIIIVLAIFYVISLSIMIIVPGSNNSLEKLVTNYPETSYQELEDEASRIIISRNFDTDYHFHIHCYDNITNYLCFDLSNDSAKITAKVENYKKNNQVCTIERNHKSSRELFAFNLLSFLIIFPLFLALLALIILMLVFSLFKFLVWILKK